MQTDFFRVSLWSAFYNVVKIGCQFVIAKLLAVLGGPAGVYLFGQLSNTLGILTSIGSGGINNGITKYTAEHKGSPDKQIPFLQKGLAITLVFSTAVAVGLAFFAPAVSVYVFKSASFQPLVIIIGVCTALFSVGNYLLSVANGFKNYQKFLRINLFFNLAVLLVVLLLVYVKKAEGALYGYACSQGLLLVIAGLSLRREWWFGQIRWPQAFSFSIFKSLFTFTIMALVAGISLPLTQMLIRQAITAGLNVHAAGIWEGMNRISVAYLSFITTVISVYYLPRLSEIPDDVSLGAEIRHLYALCLPVLLLGSAALYLLRDVAISLLYTPDFREMRSLFGLQLIGDLLKISAIFIAYLFWTKAKMVAFVATEIGASVLMVIAARFLLHRFGLQGATLAYCLTNFAYLATVLSIFRKTIFAR